MQGLQQVEELSGIEVRQEARFVLWALRCCALERQRNNPGISIEIVRGFELADVLETLSSFRDFAGRLQAAASRVVWHGPACGCVSSGEMHVLHALSQVAESRREAQPSPSRWWRLLLSDAQLVPVDSLARHWLTELHRAGIEYPGSASLIEALSPLQLLMDEAPGRRATLN